VPKKAQFTHERVEYNVFLFHEPLKGSKSLKTFKISLTFRFDKLSHLSKSVHIGENYQILTVSNKKNMYFIKLNSQNELHQFSGREWNGIHIYALKSWFILIDVDILTQFFKLKCKIGNYAHSLIKNFQSSRYKKK
jgi:hypothetical protein